MNFHRRLLRLEPLRARYMKDRLARSSTEVIDDTATEIPVLGKVAAERC